MWCDNLDVEADRVEKCKFPTRSRRAWNPLVQVLHMHCAAEDCKSAQKHSNCVRFKIFAHNLNPHIIHFLAHENSDTIDFFQVSLKTKKATKILQHNN